MSLLFTYHRISSNIRKSNLLIHLLQYRCLAGRKVQFFGFTAIAACLLFFSAHAQTISRPITGSDAIWQFRKAGDTLWQPAMVPGTIHTDLLQLNMIPDPYYGAHEKSVQWIEEKAWEYQTFFDCPEALMSMQHIEMQFDGLDTYADVYLNDTLLLQADNMFRTYRVNVKHLLLSQENKLLIHFHSAVRKGKEATAMLPYPMAGDVDGKAFTRKAQYQYGWDWGPRLITAGIWKPVHILGWSALRLEQAYVTTQSITAQQAQLELHLLIQCDSDRTLKPVFTSDSATVLMDTGDLHVKAGRHDYTIPFTMDHPKRWNCNGQGIPYLYQFKFTALVSRPSISISSEVRFGVRTVDLIQEKDSAGSSFYFLMNGAPLFVKGANFIPPGNFLPSVTEAEYEKIVDDAVAANMNMLRVWGGGTYGSDAFYDLCDEKGLLVWQDFMFAGAMVPGESGFVENVKQEVTDQVIRLRSHPSLALWCGNNEVDEAWHNWGWQAQYKYTDTIQHVIWQHYNNLFHQVIPDVIRQYDPDRDYWPSSPSIGWGHPESLQQGDSHYWGVWWGKEPFDRYQQKVGRFMSEYGFQALPSIHTINWFTTPSDRLLQSNGPNRFSQVMNVHQKHPTGFETIDEYLGRDYRLPKDFESYVYVSQLLQRDGIAIAIAAHRRSMPYCMGTLYWQLNDCWPVTSWSSRDYFGNWKALHYQLKQLYSPVLLSVHEVENGYHVTIVSDYSHQLKGQLKLMLLRFNGDTVWSFGNEVHVPANSAKVVHQVNNNELPARGKRKHLVLACQFMTTEESAAAVNHYFVKPKDLALPDAEVQYTLEFQHDASSSPAYPFQYKIACTSTAFAKDVFIDADTEQYQLSDNFFDLLPGETKSCYLYSKVYRAPSLIRLNLFSLVDSY